MEKINTDYKRRTESPSAKFFSMWNRDGAQDSFSTLLSMSYVLRHFVKLSVKTTTITLYITNIIHCMRASKLIFNSRHC